jgi:hypothetical protein
MALRWEQERWRSKGSSAAKEDQRADRERWKSGIE